MEIKNVNSLSELEVQLKEKENLFLLLYKKGSEQSDCAYDNLKNIESNDLEVFAADVSQVRDIHPKFGIKSAPSFLEFSKGKHINTYKGCHEKDFFKNLIQGSVFTASNDSEEKPQKRVTVYSTPTCSWCTRLKTYLDMRGVRYTDVDVSKDPKAAEDLVKRSGQ